MKGPILVCKLCRRWRIDQVTEEFLLGGEHGGAPLPAQRSVDAFRAGTRPYADLECTARCNYVVLPEAVYPGQVVLRHAVDRRRRFCCGRGSAAGTRAQRHADDRCDHRQRLQLRHLPSPRVSTPPASTSNTSSPYLRSFESPTPDTRRSSARFDGRAAAIALRVESWNTTYAGTPVERAVSRRHRLRRSTSSTGASPCAVDRRL